MVNKLLQTISRILSWAIIYLSATLLLGSICLPCTSDEQPFTGFGPIWYYTWHFSMQGLPAINVTIESRGLLPHIFTLIATGSVATVIFCGTVSYSFRNSRLLTGALFYAVRTFLLPFDQEAIARPAAEQRY